MNTPLSIMIRNTKQELVSVINNSGLHPDILLSITKELYDAVSTEAERQYKIELEEYNKQTEEDTDC